MSPAVEPPRAAAAPAFLTSSALKRAGVKKAELARALANGTLIRTRRGRYIPGDSHPEIAQAARLGGRLDCVSLLRRAGVFVLERSALHLQVDVGASRLPPRPQGVVCHWRVSRAARESLIADRIEALAQAVRCQGPREAVATLDSACHLGFVTEAEIALVFARLPRRYQALRALLEPRSESGSESLMRLILRTLSCQFDVQVSVRGVGRVDFVVDGWLIIECDSKEFHSTWEAQKRDRRRDLNALALGYTTVRVLAEDVFFHRDQVRAALQSALAHGPGSGTRTRPPARG